MTEERLPLAILFVDDEQNILRAITRLFLDEPYELLTATSGVEGLALLRERPEIGVIVSDQRMPGMSGAEFLEQSRVLVPDAVRIVLTGYADVTAAMDAINKGGAWRYLTKPWKDEELLQTVREAAERYGLVAENRRLTELVNRQNEELTKWNAELELLVQQQTIDIQNKNKTLEKLNERLRRNFSDTLHVFADLLELRDKKTGSHSRNVSELAGSMARLLKLPSEETSVIVVAGLLHDIGKIGIPDSLLGTKYEALSSEHKALYRSHSVRGQAAVDVVEDLRKAGVLIRHHHEAWDGTGFPDSLRGDAIPIGSRILALADYFDRAVASLPAGTAAEDALRAAQNNLNKLFDPDLFPALVQCVAPLHRPVPTRTARQLEIEVRPVELKEGMVLTREVRSGTGVLLLKAGTTLTAKSIEAITRFFKIDPSRENIFIAAK